MNSNPQRQFSDDLTETRNLINELLSKRSDKDWNYSRITLQLRPLTELDSPYVLWVEYLDFGKKTAKAEVSKLTSEISWGERHSDELGILEIVSLRMNKALIEVVTSGQSESRHFIRVVKRQSLEEQGIDEAFWYEVQEVRGEDFDNR